MFPPARMLQRLKSLFVPHPATQRPRENSGSVPLHGFVEPCTIELDTGGSDNDLRLIRESLYAFNIGAAGNSDYQPLNLVLRDAKAKTAGGLISSSSWGWLQVSFLWVDESVQRKGFGRQLLLTAEKLAAGRKCRHVSLEAFSFQRALPFYERLGYVQFGVLEDYPDGHRKYFLQKQLR